MMIWGGKHVLEFELLMTVKIEASCTGVFMPN